MRRTLASARPKMGLLRTVAGLAILVASAATILITAPSAIAQTDLEHCLLDKINGERASIGAPPMVWAEDIAPYTRDHSSAMASSGGLYHSTSDQLDGVLPDSWYAWGENVGYISVEDCDGMHQGFMDSTGHRDNLLNATYEFAATGVHIDGNGWLWTTHVFFAATEYDPSTGTDSGTGSASTGGAQDGTFSDDDGSSFENDIEALVAAGITNGCGNGLFCPKDLVNREQMAAFLNRGLQLPDRGNYGFLDVSSGSTFFDDINAIAWDGITQGCGSGYYCPTDGVTRAQMAAFLVRALDLPAAPDAGFKDVATSATFADVINRLAAAGITNGCGNGYFCPDEIVNREQMAAFLVRALGL